MNEKLQIEYVSMFELMKWPQNPKDHDLGELHGSIQEFGFRKPIVVNRNNKQIEAGHGRLDTLMQKFNAGEAPPKYIILNEAKKEWLVPVVWMDDDELTQYRYSLADNRLQDKGGYNWAKLVEVADYLYEASTLDYTGYTVDDIEAIRENYLEPSYDYDEGGGGTGGGEGEDDILDKFEVIVLCDSQQEQSQLFERLKGEGYRVQVKTSKNE